MGSLSFSTHGGLPHWQVFLVAVSVFIFWSQPTTAEVSIVPASVTEGQAALLPLHNAPPNVTAFVWYRGKGTSRNQMIALLFTFSKYDVKGPEYRGREKINADGSLLIDNVALTDAGMYTVVAHVTNVKKEIAFGKLDVHTLRCMLGRVYRPC